MDVARLEQKVLHARREASDHEEVVTELRQKLLDTARERDDCIRSKAELVSQLDQERARATSLSLELQQAQAVFSDTSPMRPSRLTLESETLPARAQATKSQLARLGSMPSPASLFLLFSPPTLLHPQAPARTHVR